MDYKTFGKVFFSKMLIDKFANLLMFCTFVAKIQTFFFK